MTIPTEPPPAAAETDDEAAEALPSDAAPDPSPAATPPASDSWTGTAAGAHTAPPHSTDRFFLWVSGLGIARTDGWLGGVAAGIAVRLRIDPLIVRGVLVVAALFGLPVIFLYALAWALLPDSDGRIHTRDLLRGDYQPVQIGILAMAVIGLIPTAPITGTVFGLGYAGWSALSLISWLVGLVIVAGLLFLIVRAASRTPGAAAPDLPMASADPAAPGAPVTLSDSGTAEGTGATPSNLAPPAAAPDRPEPPGAPVANDPESLAAWRAQHAAWKEQDQAWRRQQQDAERAVRDQLRRERQAEAAVFATEAAERRRVRRASNPRASFAYVAAVIGLAIVAGSGVTLFTLQSGLGEAAGAIGLLSAALMLALGMIVAGAWRRRSGFLAFVTALTLAAGLITGSVASFSDLAFGSRGISNVAAQTINQPFGDLYMTLMPHDDGPRPLVVNKGSGSTQIDLEAGVRLDLKATVGALPVEWVRIDDETGTVVDSGIWTSADRHGSQTLNTSVVADRGSITTIQPVTITQRSGSITVTIHEPAEEER
ncbi:PspC domain-containing protein [Microbacterium sp. LWH10-1.2]|uniref:PspC domain-containing protein n=1 Tax=Microbacterium sp. LWH10-1.2 TaxID=3135255 RepID=UPI00313978D5